MFILSKVTLDNGINRSAVEYILHHNQILGKMENAIGGLLVYEPNLIKKVSSTALYPIIFALLIAF